MLRTMQDKAFHDPAPTVALGSSTSADFDGVRPPPPARLAATYFLQSLSLICGLLYAFGVSVRAAPGVAGVLEMAFRRRDAQRSPGMSHGCRSLATASLVSPTSVGIFGVPAH